MQRYARLLIVAVAIVATHCSGKTALVNGGRDMAMHGGGGGGGSGGGGGASGSDGGAFDLAQGPIITPGSPGAVDVTLTIHADQLQHAISPLIYGVNNGNQAAAHHATIVRSGGNRLTAYNWETNASNAGTDYGGCENDDYLCGTTTCAPNNDAPGAYLKAVIDQARAAGAATLVTVPIVDYVAADKNAASAINCTFNASRFRMNVATKGAAFSDPPATTDNYVYQDEMVNWLGVHEAGASLRFLLDNEPDLWSSTHPEVHPMPVTYAELAMRNLKYAQAIKAVMPNVEVWGPVNYGWNGYVNLQNASDAQTNGDFLNWWLGQMAAATMNGKRLVDGMDLHWYPEVGDGGAMTTAGYDCRITRDPMTDKGMPADCYTPAAATVTAAQRVQAPRSLWDASFVENSWIASSIGGAAIGLVPRMQAKIAMQAPGMKLSFSEWSYGGGSDVSGALATADALGIFGSFGVDMATLWETWHDESFTYAAFDAYRNFDGKGAAFGDTSVSAASSDVATATVYGSVSASAPSRLIIVAINKAATTKTAGLVIYHATTFPRASIFTITQAGGAKVVAGSGITSVATNAFAYAMPAQSVSVIVPAP
jgi:hypothetical protein